MFFDGIFASKDQYPRNEILIDLRHGILPDTDY